MEQLKVIEPAPIKPANLNDIAAAKLSEVAAEAMRINLSGGSVTLHVSGDQILISSNKPWVYQTAFIRHSEASDLIQWFDHLIDRLTHFEPSPRVADVGQSGA